MRSPFKRSWRVSVAAGLALGLTAAGGGTAVAWAATGHPHHVADVELFAAGGRHER